MSDCPGPGCQVRIPTANLELQREHMLEAHPEIIADRLRDAHFTWNETTRTWVDGWADG